MMRRNTMAALVLALGLAACGMESESSSYENDQDALKNAGANGGSGSDKISICHIPPGNPSNAHTIVVGAPAERAHLDHGDTLGECPADGGTTDPGVTPDAGSPHDEIG
jgi:hypothetical protein